MAGLTLVGVCMLHCSEVDWVRESIAGYVMCEPAHTEYLCQWPSVLQSVCYVGERFTCRELPNNSFLIPYCMVSIIPVFPLQCRIRVCCLVCAMHTLRSGYWFLCIVCVLYVLLLLLTWLSYTWIVANVTFESVYPTGICTYLMCSLCLTVIDHKEHIQYAWTNNPTSA